MGNTSTTPRFLTKRKLGTQTSCIAKEKRNHHASKSPTKIEGTKNGRRHGGWEGQKEEMVEGQIAGQGRQQGPVLEGAVRTISRRGAENEAHHGQQRRGKIENQRRTCEAGAARFGSRRQNPT